MTTSTAEWLLEIGGLTVGSPAGEDPVHQGHLLAAQIRSAAAAFRAATAPVDHDVADCPLSAFDGGHAACALARLLSPEIPLTTTGDAHRCGLLYIQAIRAAGTAVFHCRHAHAAGECWFSVDGAPLCGDVLAAAHRLGV